MRVNGDAAPVVTDRDRVIGEQFNFDAIGVTGDGLIH